MIYTRHAVLSILIILTGIVSASAQQIKFRHYGADQICHPFVYTINQDKNGYIWAGTGQGLCRFDGFEFTQPSTGDSASQAYISCSYKDRNGNMWFGKNDGTILKFQDRNWSKISVPGEITSTINAIAGDESGNVYCISQSNGIIRIGDGGKVQLFDTLFNGELLYTATIVHKDILMLGSANGLSIYKLSTGAPVFQEKVSNFPFTRVQCIISLKNEDAWLVGTEDMGIQKVIAKGKDFNTFSSEPFGPEWKLEYENVNWILQDGMRNLWISLQGKGLRQLTWSDKEEKWTRLLSYDEQNGLASNYVRTVFQDREGMIWIGTYGEGMQVMAGTGLVFYPWEQKIGKNISALTADANYRWIAGSKAILRIHAADPAKEKIFRLPSMAQEEYVTSLVSPGGNTLWIGTSNSGIFRMDINSGSISRVFYSGNSLQNSINHMTFKDDKLYAATNEGLVILPLTGGKPSFRSMSDGLPHNLIHQIYITPQGEIWLATRTSGLYELNSNRILPVGVAGEIEFTGITQDPEGNFWAATDGDGVILFAGDSVYQYSTRNGLASNYVYSIYCDRFGMIWTGHRQALSRIKPQTASVAVFDRSAGILGDCNPSALIQTSDGTILVGTTSGLISYDVGMEQNTGADPALNIASIRINDKEYAWSDEIILPPGRYKIRIDFVGLNYRSPERIIYQYQMEGFDPGWMDPSNTRTALYSNLSNGNYSFLLRACNEDGICTNDEVMFRLKIRTPFYKYRVVQIIFVLIMIGLGFVLNDYRNRKKQQAAEERKRWLESELEKRTREVVQQKEEIETKNRDIMDSIEYAHRIQQSVLPSASKFQGVFGGSFIFYQPRDIVSGDFYWFDLVRNNRFLIVCADSTGHGVPGAFMSMMGTTLVKDICFRTDLESPSEMLAVLDREIHGRLNQNLEAERANDGMDIIICEIDIETKYVRFASAMRPFILYQGGEQIYVQGSRSSIGGGYESRDEKIFEEQGFQLAKGDIIYMFSDGYTDQFGGPMGKKFKMVRLRNLLRDIHQRPMTEQYSHVKNNFNLWKDTYPQVDDVLFMGIQL